MSDQLWTDNKTFNRFAIVIVITIVGIFIMLWRINSMIKSGCKAECYPKKWNWTYGRISNFSVECGCDKIKVKRGLNNERY